MSGKNIQSFEHSAAGSRIVRSFYQQYGLSARGPNAELVAKAVPVLAILAGEAKLDRGSLQTTMHQLQPSLKSEMSLPKIVSIDEAIARLKCIARIFLVPYMSPYTRPDDTGAWVPKLQTHLGQYAVEFGRYRDSEPPEEFQPGFFSKVSLVHSQLWVFSILSRALPSLDETTFDRYFPVASSSLEKSKYEITATSGHIQEAPEECDHFKEFFGLITHSFFTVSKMRDPTSRRAVLKILQRIPQTNDIWSRDVVHAFGQQIMAIEERGLVNLSTAADVPETNRIRAVDIRINMEEQSAFLRYIKYPYTVESTVFEEEIPAWPWKCFQDFDDHKAKVNATSSERHTLY